MKLHSIQFKFLMTVIFAILAIAIFIGGLSIYEVDNYIQQQTEDLVKITCSNEAAQINDIFGDIEKSVKIMESYVLSLFESSSDITDRDHQAEILELAGKMFGDVASNTDGAIAYYLRFNPAISNNTAGIFYTIMSGSDEYLRLPPTDLSLYDKDDTEHVGWFWQPYEAGHPIWLAPYYNQNSKLLMISYVIPLYFEDQFIGVVGMDFDYTVLRRRVNEIKIYENGFAHLEMDNAIIQKGNESKLHTLSDKSQEEYMRVSEELDNGMTLVLSACYDDIRQIRYEIIYKILFMVILLTMFFSLIVFFMVKKVVKPLRDLTNASIKLANRKYDVEISPSSTYEIEQLRTAFASMLVNLREHEVLQHRLAYTDSLTGLRNTTAFLEWTSEFNKKIKNEDVSFGIVVLDLNYLKEANDTYGHIAGNALIIGAARIISDNFKRSPVFRIGGDEFVVILQNRDLEEREALFAKFEEECANAWAETEEVKLPISIAKGFALYDPAKDTQVSEVFDRADDEMYANKKSMKITVR